jgi:hypothetical protein
MVSIEPLGGDPFPWYRSHRRAALVTAAVLFVAVTGIHVLVNGTGQAVDILYALPIALLAMSFGLRGGLVGAAIGFALFAVVEVLDGVGDIDVTGWVTRGAGLFLLGVLLGQATDHIEAGQRRALTDLDERRALADRARRQAEALEISDSIIQHLAVAKWRIESGDTDEAIVILTSTMATGERMVADLLPIRRGDIGTGGAAPTPTPEPGAVRADAGPPEPGAVRAGRGVPD